MESIALCSCTLLALCLVLPAKAAPGSGGDAPPAPTATPQYYGEFQELPINTITPRGWLREFLNRQITGLSGHRNILSYPYDTCLWAGEIPRQGKHGSDWWRYEQTAYLTDGLIRLGYLMNDPDLVAVGRDGIAYTFDHPLANGRLGRAFFTTQWPMAVFFRAIQAEYSATRDPKIISVLNTHYSSYSADDVAGPDREIVTLEGMLWTYGCNGNGNLLRNAEAAYHDLKRGGNVLTLGHCLSPNLIVVHGVTYMEEAKLPAILYMYTGKKEYLDGAVNAFRKLDRDHMLPDGVPSSNEYLGGKDPLVSHETCDISDYTWSAGYLLMATGDATWADHIERAVFNAGPGAVSKDFKNLQYFSSVNQVITTGNSDNNYGSTASYYGGSWMAYWPCHDVECCAGNVHRFMPNFAARMWMTDRNGGLVAAMYSPSRISFTAPDGQKVTVEEDTNYPFSETITFRFATQGPTRFPFIFRVPGWCPDASATINGSPAAEKLQPGTFTTIDRVFADGDEIVLHLPMRAHLLPWMGGVAVERGPLLYTFAVPEKVTIDTKVYPNLNGKRSPDPKNFPALDIQPNGAWNYALATRSDADLQVEETKAEGYPLDPNGVSTVIRVPVHQVLDWSLIDGRFTPPLPAPGSFECEKELQYIELVPYGSTRLRLTVFPEFTLAGAGANEPATSQKNSP